MLNKTLSRARLSPGISIFVSLLAMTLAVAALMFVFSRVDDAKQIETEQQIVNSAIKDALTKLGESLRQNSYWDTAYDQISGPIDPDWAEKNLGPYAKDTSKVAAVFIIGADDKPTYEYMADENDGRLSDFETDPAVVALVREARAKESAPPTLGLGFVEVGGKVYLGAASLVVPNDERAELPLERLNVEVYLLEFDASLISKVQTDFHVSQVSLSNAPPPPALARINLSDAAGAEVAYLSWRAATPGSGFALSIAPYALLCIASIGLLLWFALRNWVTTVRLLEKERNESHRLRDESWAKTVVLTNISHELRTPLNAIIGFSEIIKGELFGPLSEQYRGYGGDIFASGKHLLGIVDELLDLARLEHGGELSLESVVVPDGLRATCDLLSERARASSIPLDIDIAPAYPIMVNGRALNRIVANLGANAIKFSKAGNPARIVVYHDTEEQKLVVKVRDQGCGIPAEKLPFLGEPFYQAESSFTRRPGTGLGLAMVKSLINRFGGTLAVESKVGEGTTVKVTLPVGTVTGQADLAPQANKAAA
jgi:signal transduction histidine kinase